ncbi:MAG TPA: hypothetical protein VHO03_13715 [Ignavibacteriales bacterium]|nr:hypothetical protein [Ignavibacteriales bacterium]
MSPKKSAYSEWSIEKGDYVRKDLSKEELIRPKVSPMAKYLITGLAVLTVILVIVLQAKLSHF